MQKISTQVLILLLSVFILACSDSQATDINLNNTPAQIYFSPHVGCTDTIVKDRKG